MYASRSGGGQRLYDCVECLVECALLAGGRLHAWDEAPYLADDPIQLGDGTVQPAGVCGRGSFDLLSHMLQPHADGIERLEDIVVQILADPLPFVRDPFPFRNVFDHGEQEWAGMAGEFDPGSGAGDPDNVPGFPDIAFFIGVARPRAAEELFG